MPLLPQAARMPGNVIAAPPIAARLSSCRLVRWSVIPAPSIESTTNVESGLHEISLGACSAAPGSLFWT